MFRGVSVWVEGPASEGGAMAHASEWAGRLRLPLRTVACPAPPARDFFRPFELCVFGGALAPAARQMLLAHSLQSPQASVMICPPAWRPASRVLILNQHRRPGDGFLEAVVGLCQSLQVAPVVLTVARSEVEARGRERAVEEAFAGRLTVDCDFVAGCDVTTAVARAAHWRRCSHVFVERRPAPPWRRWLGGDVLRDLTCLSDCLAIVGVPEGTALPPSPLAGVGTKTTLPASEGRGGPTTSDGREPSTSAQGDCICG